MTREQFLEEGVDLMKEMTPEQRGQLVADLLEISLQLTLKEASNHSVKEALNKSERKVS